MGDNQSTIRENHTELSIMTSALKHTFIRLPTVTASFKGSAATLTTSSRAHFPGDAGSVASSKDFKQREKSEELRYAREKEAQELKKLREELTKHKHKLEQLENSI